MPRQARLNAPGMLQHVMARGIEKKGSFAMKQTIDSLSNDWGGQRQCWRLLYPNAYRNIE